MSKTETRLLSGAVGLLLVVIATILENTFRTHEKAVQVIVWSLIETAILSLGNCRHVRTRWFWQGIFLAAVVHSVIVISFLRSMPFPDVGIVILLAFPEVVLLQISFIRLSRV